MLTLHQHVKLKELKKKYQHDIALENSVREDDDLLSILLIMDFHHTTIANIQSLHDLYPDTDNANENLMVIFHLLGLISGQALNIYGKSIAEPNVLRDIFYKSYGKKEEENDTKRG